MGNGFMSYIKKVCWGCGVVVYGTDICVILHVNPLMYLKFDINIITIVILI